MKIYQKFCNFMFPSLVPSALYSIMVMNPTYVARKSMNDSSMVRWCVTVIGCCRSTLDLGLPREPCERDIKLKIHKCSMRVAMSHLTLHRLVKRHIPVVLNALTGLPSKHEVSVDCAADPADPANAFTTVVFRQTVNKVHLCIDEAALWLCTDGSRSFGAPDVMQVCSFSKMCLEKCVFQ